MARQKIQPAPAALVEPKKHTNEFAGLTEDARHDLAVTRIRSLWVIATGAIVGIGQTLVDACHEGNDDEALLDTAAESAMFQRIRASLGTVEGGPSDTTLRNARRVVASNATYRSHFWKVLPFSHKVLLLPLVDTAKVADGAQRAVEQSWTQSQLEEWVAVERKGTGNAKKKRFLRLRPSRAALKRVAACADPKSLERLGDEYEALDRAGRKAVRDEVDRAAAALVKLRRKLAAIND